MCFHTINQMLEVTKEDMQKRIKARTKFEAIDFEEYARHHAPLTVAFHQDWKSYTMFLGYTLPTEYTVSKPYVSQYECEKEAKLAVRNAYDLANRYVTAGDSKSVAKRVAKEYADLVRSVFSTHKELLKSCCDSLGHTVTYEKIDKLVYDCEKELESVYDRELLDSSDYYKMYRLDYFYDKIEIETADSRISEGEAIQALESLFTSNIQYFYTGVWSAISELEKDLNEHLATFYRVAYLEYMNYISKIETLLDSLDNDFMKQPNADNKESAITKAIKSIMKQENG